MSGWTIFNFDTKDRSEIDRELTRPPSEALQKAAHQTLPNCMASVQYHGTAVARVSGYRDWEDDEEAALSVAPSLWDRVVIIQANDTADMGSARLYHQSNDGLYCSDEYHETEDEGNHVGDKAAAVMFTLHNIPCMANFQHPYDFLWQKGRWSDDE